ncbi:aldehyde dehydrogenase family protein [Streptomyces europaeiscabiei]|uniref:Aldehyde dehydrogenase family protein n=1 Tax=Streptomyces europaeiscabiei TaxID=146819 RepID=A0ABU4NKR8_9ACTN|nr:aldehyde dehydrogenase family protein [Streptomyces europaeiscabiei]MDX2764326.1 aldehyde dehydrogenase family protein [Streptomyces europaeiscabiei]MDX3548903.1 aldehyde dehydrogenase family protein [Streptomyces europaeiscabiei]MDX3555844.1 aldehyde dehydrogenase family protein [Streptomyces europaeiscabiei]MDX3669839.1 aldehyde dehydrogenase family protein [Streptomyces europaeiscabiei]MDX3703286.1 aldehyde dehydrogenase family protein [Streptomyces europaeiscabiei]
MTATHAFWLAGRQATGETTFDVTSPWDGRLVGRVSVPTDEQVEEAVAAAYAVRDEFAATPAHVRAAVLDHVSRGLVERTEEIAQLISAENGKPIKWARGEVGRAVSVFRFAAEEARRFNGGEAQRLDTDLGGQGRLALTRRFPKGVVLGIAPFNFPLNLCAHKIAPAIAAGVPIILKPAPATPLSGLVIGDLLAEAATALPAGSWSILPVANDRMPALVQDERLPVISFTGSEKVGYAIMDSAPRKHCTLELGGNGAAVVLADYTSDEDLDWAAGRIATFSNYQGGQSCISVQRVIVDASVYDRLLPRIVAAVEAQVTGDPSDGATDVGPLVSEDAAKRVETWVREAVDAGAALLTGGKRDGASYAPTVLADVPAEVTISCEEVFGPVLTVRKVEGEAEAFAAVNDSKYGLQAGVFTHDLQTAFRAHRALEVGGVVIGDVPSYRADQMPYGGTKQSGVGREGVRFAMDDYTYERVMVLTGLQL